MMAEKARIMGDEDTRMQILATEKPKDIKALGSLVKNFDPKKWDENRVSVVTYGNLLMGTITKRRTRTIFPAIMTAFSLTHSLRMIFSQKCSKEQGAESLRSWYGKVAVFGNKALMIQLCMTERMKSLTTLSIGLQMPLLNLLMQK